MLQGHVVATYSRDKITTCSGKHDTALVCADNVQKPVPETRISLLNFLVCVYVLILSLLHDVATRRCKMYFHASASYLFHFVPKMYPQISFYYREG